MDDDLRRGSMERSKSFVKALHELKNLRPQLYSAVDYCEKSYLHSEQKQMVLDNLKDYTVKALVNVVDHLGTVASKLTNLFDQQSYDISTMELRASCVSQQLLTCGTLSVLSDDLNQDRIIAMRQKWRLCEIDVEDYFFVLLTRLFQSIQRHIYLKGPMDKVTSVAIPLAFAASSLYMINCVFMLFHVFLESVMFFTE
ncbi:hypothetical protein HID58_070683 [Brassica napus]|uniref:Protein ABIL1 n=1 Tax=Brassica napus TaxID=3708 RepID=A0ABQ7YZL0_BRANA|nr:hypothetical protein HID58_070683 [Brassica napus]